MRALNLPALRERRTRLSLLAAGAAAGWVLHLNFLAFHGSGASPRVYLHLHDVAHYYLGSKYFPELGYTDLYTAMLRAEAERYGDRFAALEARDLESHEVVHVRTLLERSDPVKARFAPERWRSFREDVGFFRDALGPQWAEVLRDHGFNATPVWAQIGGAIASRAPASERGLLALASLDPLLLAGLFGAIAWAFGAETCLLAMIYYAVLHGASFGWTGGAFLRFGWLFGVVVGACCLARGRSAAGGALFGLATSLRVFPAAFALGLACKAGHELLERRRLSRGTAAALGAFAATVLLLVGATAAEPGAAQRWREFASNLERHTRGDAWNLIGMTEILSWRSTPETETAAAGQEVARGRIHALQILVLAPLSLLFLYRRSRRDPDVALAAAGIPILFATLNLAAYYYAFLVLLVPVFRDRPGKLALLLAVEAATYLLQSFDDRPATVFLYRNLLLAYALAALYGWDQDRRRSAEPTISSTSAAPAANPGAESDGTRGRTA
jgi:hypothetical protein